MVLVGSGELAFGDEPAFSLSGWPGYSNIFFSYLLTLVSRVLTFERRAVEPEFSKDLMAALHRSLADRCWALERWLLLTSKGNSAEVHSSRDSLHQAKGKGCHGDCSASANGTYRVPALCCLGQHSLMEVMEPYWSNINFIWVWEAYSHSSWIPFCFPSVQFSRSVISNSLRPHGLQHSRPPCPSPTPGVDSKSCPLSRWCHPTISSSVIPFSSCLQSFPASGPCQMSQFFT